MRLAVLADTHGNVLALEAVLADIRMQAPDATVDLGDCVSGPLWPRETAELLMSLNLPTVRGNHDRQVSCDERDTMDPADSHAYDEIDAKHRSWLAALPLTLEPCSGVLACHGNPKDDNGLLIDRFSPGHGLVLAPQADVVTQLGDERAPVVLCGHTHVPRIVWVTRHGEPGQLVVNPGSVGVPAFEHKGAAYDIGAPHARYAILTLRAGRWHVDLKSVAYDWGSAAKRAMANGWRDWAAGLTTGYAR